MHPGLDRTSVEFDAATLAHPYPAYAALRATPGLVRHEREGYFLVSRYDEIREAAMRPDDFSSGIVEVLVRSARLPGLAVRAVDAMGPVDVLAVVDAPRHAVHRKLATRHFGREPVAHALDRMRPFIDARLDAYFASAGGDFMREVAGPIPVGVALSVLGLPQQHGARVKRLSDRSVALLSGVLPREERGRLIANALELYVYSYWQFRTHRARGTGEPLFDAIASAAREGTLGSREAASMVMQVLIAGSDSTASLLGSAMRILAERPDLVAELRSDPSLVPGFVEEVLRLESPFHGHFRVVRRHTELAGRALRPGDRLMLLWASGNRDPSVYPDPDALDLRRRRGEKPHLAFGQGIHLCLGAGLARAVARTVLDGMIARGERFALADAPLRYKPSGFVRTLEALPMRVG